MNCGCNNSCYDRGNQCNSDIKRRYEYSKEDTCKDITVVDKILVVNDCSCQELMRVNDWYNCIVDKSKREFYQANKELEDAMEDITRGISYSEKAKEISDFINSYLDSVEKNKVTEKDMCCEQKCGCNTSCYNTTCCCNPCVNETSNCNTTCKMAKAYPCKKSENACDLMADKYNEMYHNLNQLECEALKATQQAAEKLAEIKKLQKCMSELKDQIVKKCYPNC